MITRYKYDKFIGLYDFTKKEIEPTLNKYNITYNINKVLQDLESKMKKMFKKYIIYPDVKKTFFEIEKEQQDKIIDGVFKEIDNTWKETLESINTPGFNIIEEDIEEFRCFQDYICPSRTEFLNKELSKKIYKINSLIRDKNLKSLEIANDFELINTILSGNCSQIDGYKNVKKFTNECILIYFLDKKLIELFKRLETILDNENAIVEVDEDEDEESEELKEIVAEDNKERLKTKINELYKDIFDRYNGKINKVDENLKSRGNLALDSFQLITTQEKLKNKKI